MKAKVVFVKGLQRLCLKDYNKSGNNIRLIDTSNHRFHKDDDEKKIQSKGFVQLKIVGKKKETFFLLQNSDALKSK